MQNSYNNKWMIVIKGEPKTSQIKSCEYNSTSKKWDVVFTNNKGYSYLYNNIERIKDYTVFDDSGLQILCGDRMLNIDCKIYKFVADNRRAYYRFVYKNGYVEEHAERELTIEKSILGDKRSRDIFDYLKKLSSINDLKNEDGSRILEAQFSKITDVNSKNVLSCYLYGKNQPTDGEEHIPPLFPFGCNRSQYEAVVNALNNRMSVIQGPPGTGKTQTILNILANLIIRGMTIQVVSNNNSAIENIREKLCEYNLEFISAILGSQDNKKTFVLEQEGTYPDFSGWLHSGNRNDFFSRILELSRLADEVFKAKEELAGLREEQNAVDLEYKYFCNYLDDSANGLQPIKLRKNMSSGQILELLEDIKEQYELESSAFNILTGIRLLFRYGVMVNNLREAAPGAVVDSLQNQYYLRRSEEIAKRISDLNSLLSNKDDILAELQSLSMEYVKDVLARRYIKNKTRPKFAENDFWQKGADVLAEYPIILSTTFSSKSSLGSRLMPVTYDYVIMDEASQVDIATGALALYSARNAVIVGDVKQLSHVVTKEAYAQSESVFSVYDIPEGYRYVNSFLDSVIKVVADIPNVLLKEHYRCHPKIIGFCNQKFYGGELIPMTVDSGEQDVLSAIVTAEGNHARGHFNQRQIDVIKQEIIPNLQCDYSEIGIISPYRDQITAMREELPDEISIDTVHKFQGREKDVIIISTVDNEVNDFSDDPNLVNVAVSRAKKRLYIVTSRNDTKKNGNISDLIDYINYNNCDVVQSKVYSIFDYLYSQYSEVIRRRLKGRKRISDYDSENLMYGLLEDILSENDYTQLRIACHVSLRNIIRDTSLMTDEERAYATNPLTHIDFSIFNNVSKQIVLAIEVDGYAYHKTGTRQSERDDMKNSILKKYEIPLLRFSTTGSGEKEILIRKLNELAN